MHTRLVCETSMESAAISRSGITSERRFLRPMRIASSPRFPEPYHPP